MPTVEKYDTADGPRYRVRFYLPKDPRLLTSKAIQRKASGFRTTREAQAHARRQIVDAERVRPDIIRGGAAARSGGLLRVWLTSGLLHGCGARKDVDHA